MFIFKVPHLTVSDLSPFPSYDIAGYTLPPHLLLFLNVFTPLGLNYIDNNESLSQDLLFRFL